MFILPNSLYRAARYAGVFLFRQSFELGRVQNKSQCLNALAQLGPQKQNWESMAKEIAMVSGIFVQGRRHSSNSRVQEGKYLQLKYTISICQKKNLDLLEQGPRGMMMFLLFPPASKRWLGWPQIRSGIFCDNYCTDILVLSVKFCGAAVLKVVNQKTLVKRRWSYKVRITVYVGQCRIQTLR